MTTLFAATTSATASSNITLTAGGETTLSLTPADLPIDALAFIELQQPNSVWQHVGSLTAQNRVQVLSAPGVFRVRKLATAVAFGVEQD